MNPHSYALPKDTLIKKNERLVELTSLLSRKLYRYSRSLKFTKVGRTLKKSIMNECEDHLQSLVEVQNFLSYLKKIANSAEPGGENYEKTSKDEKASSK